MNGTIFGIGPLEILLVVILVLLVFGPERLPDLMRQMGKGVRKLREYYVAFSSELKLEMTPFEEDIKVIKDVARDLQNDFAMIRDAADIRSIVGQDGAALAGPVAAVAEAQAQAITAAAPGAPAGSAAPVAMGAAAIAVMPSIAPPRPAWATPSTNGSWLDLPDDSPWALVEPPPRSDRLDDDNPWLS